MPAQVARSRGRPSLKTDDAPLEKVEEDMEQQHEENLEIVEMDDYIEQHADPDAQTTVNDLLDFTEYLPSDMMRSLTLIGKLDRTYVESSTKVHELAKTWSQLPDIPPNERPPPVQLRADISNQLSQALGSRIFAHAEAVRTSQNVDRHYNMAKVLLEKLQNMMDNYPTEENQLQSPSTSRSPQLSRAKLFGRADGEAGHKVRQKTIPKITVPGEVLAPYDLHYDSASEGSDVSSEGEEETPTAAQKTPVPPKIKLISAAKSPKSTNKPTRPPPELPSAEEMAAHHAALRNPPPPDAPIGSSHAPWLQLTEYELAKLRKRMKKNATWSPSDTMVARELRLKGRGPEDYKRAKKTAEDEGKSFEPTIPLPVVDGSGLPHLPPGAISLDAVIEDELPNSNRGMKLNEAKKMKREAMHRLAVEETEESSRKEADDENIMQEENEDEASPQPIARNTKPRTYSRGSMKRKRGVDGEAIFEGMGGDSLPSRSTIKRTKTETPVPPPLYGNLGQTNGSMLESPISQPAPTPTTRTLRAPLAETPVPLPIPLQRSSSSVANTSKSPSSRGSSATKQNQAASVSAKAPNMETPVPLPKADAPKQAPMVPPVREMPVREASTRQTRGDVIKRQTRGDAAKQNQDAPAAISQNPMPVEHIMTRRVSSRMNTPTPENPVHRRPGSRGKAASQEPQPSLATDRTRRTSTARNTPAPEAPPTRLSGKRSKRPAPGVVSTTSSGGNSAIGKRKAAPKKKARASKKEKDQTAEVEMEDVDVDDEGNPIDPNEPRYCVCNRVSFGTMIQCDNADSCKQEWFHLECVNLEAIPARTTKWFCPDCRKTLHIGGKGQISARGVRR